MSISIDDRLGGPESGHRNPYTLAGETALPFEDAVERIRQELAREGFGVLAEIDVQATLRAKLGVEREPYLILGACSAPDAHQALEIASELGALLPCNVVVYTDHGRTRIVGVDPRAMLGLVGETQLDQIAERVRERLLRALRAVWSTSADRPRR